MAPFVVVVAFVDCGFADIGCLTIESGAIEQPLNIITVLMIKDLKLNILIISFLYNY
jgi:hypothetical protein